MKVYSIGREVGCDIVINDNSDVISRRHATLNVSPTGKMTIVDLSHNGTYVNGIRIAQNVPVPVTRKDNVSFAHVARLDWSLLSLHLLSSVAAYGFSTAHQTNQRRTPMQTLCRQTHWRTRRKWKRKRSKRTTLSRNTCRTH